MLKPGSTIGILGGGQLGRMLSIAAARLGFDCHIYCPDPESPAFRVSASHTIADYDDLRSLDAFAQGVDVVTYEFENVELTAVDRLEKHVPVRPGAKALSVSQDRLLEKHFMEEHGIAVAPHAAIETVDDLMEAFAQMGGSAILKTRRFGYDGKGQIRIDTADMCETAFDSLKGAPSVLETFVPFAKEISVIAVRGIGGETIAYDPAENVHRNHILHTSTVPARIESSTAGNARQTAGQIADALDYTGALGVEFFVLGDGTDEQLIVNEIAPRVHNSGHWTEDACACSQFENHIRAISGWPLAPTDRWSDVVMTNLIGDDVDVWPGLASEADDHIHLYGKREIRPGRKMGHVNRLVR